MEPQYYPGDNEWVRSQLQKTQNVKWATRVLVYGAVNRLPGWPTLWELLAASRGREPEAAIPLARLLLARMAARVTGKIVELLPQKTQVKVLEGFKRVF